uniref:Uncharacterized protein n=1 Tax=Acanthochromis polyacanthus TaxID=80966 RepID=A0A3Q1H7H5_9TELE
LPSEDNNVAIGKTKPYLSFFTLLPLKCIKSPQYLLISLKYLASHFANADRYRALILCCLFLTGKNHDPEETVLTDHFTGSARTRELPEREKQFAPHASEGKNIFCMLML